LHEFAIRDEVMVRVRPEMFPLKTLKKLYARRMSHYKALRRFGSNAYKLDISRDLGINLVCNVEDLTFYRTPVAYSTTILAERASPFRSLQSFPVQPPLPPPLRRPPTEEIEGILTDEIVSTADGTYHHYLVCWRGRPDFDCTWLRAE